MLLLYQEKSLRIKLEKIRFNGILISDDISMKALKYNLVVNKKNL